MLKGPIDSERQRSPQEVAAYVAELLADLSRMARVHRLDVLGYLLDMARLEATNAASTAQTRRLDPDN